MELILDRKVLFRGLSATSGFLLELPSYSDATLVGKGDGRRGVKLGAMGVTCKSRVLMSNARSFVAASRIESAPTKIEM
jgi:hypothetical protein